jgi:acetoin utilization deacetylase AcuC-like enzyme
MSESSSASSLTIVSSSLLELQNGKVTLSDIDQVSDSLDNFNHPRLRRARILEAILSRKATAWEPAEPATSLSFYESVHTQGLLTFLMTAQDAWERLGEEGRDEIGWMKAADSPKEIPPLVPPNMPLPRISSVSGKNYNQRPSKHVLGQVGYYCNDTCTPIFASLVSELLADAGIVEHAVQVALKDYNKVVYAVPTHPGHHAASDSYGGYCYVNHVAAMAQSFRQCNKQKVAILDVDYHCGNGTASIFYNDPDVLVVSLHCDPDFDYPFHNGYADEEGDGAGQGATMHLPLPPGTSWTEYRTTLQRGLERLQEFGAQAVIVSLGLDTYDQDPCTIRRAGFRLQDNDYVEMGALIGEHTMGLPIVFLQEGGYRMDKVAQAATDVVTSCYQARQKTF